jgi:hypothetical protein
MTTGILDRYIIARERNVVRVDFRRETDPPTPKFPGAGALRKDRSAAPSQRIHDQPQQSGGHMTRLFAMLMAGALIAPLITPALGNESITKLGNARESRSMDWEALLSAEFNKVPWLKFDMGARLPRSDLPIGPKLDTLEPFLLQPASPGTQFSSSWKFVAQTTTE